MDLGYLGIGLVLVLGIAVVGYGWLADRADTRRRQDALTRPPERPIPGLPQDAPAPTYLTPHEALHPATRATTAVLGDAELAALKLRLAGSPSLAHGHAAVEFATDEASHLCVLDRPLVLVGDDPVTTVRELLPFLEKSRARERSVVVVAPALHREVLATLQVNAAQRTLGCAAVLLPDAGQRRALCSLVGAVPLSSPDLRAGYVPDASLGTCATWVSSPSQLWILNDEDAETP